MAQALLLSGSYVGTQIYEIFLFHIFVTPLPHISAIIFISMVFIVTRGNFNLKICQIWSFLVMEAKTVLTEKAPLFEHINVVSFSSL